MKQIMLLLLAFSLAVACKDNTPAKNSVLITSDSTYVISHEGQSYATNPDSIFIISGREILKDSIRTLVVPRIVYRSYKIGDTAYTKYENRYFIVDSIKAYTNEGLSK